MSIKKQGNIDPIRDRQAISRAIDRELSDIGQDLVATAVDYLVRRNINVDGDLMKSVRSQVDRLTQGWRLAFGAGARHAIFVHEGTRPHWPPEKPIRRWVFKKLNFKGAELDRVTFLVRAKIARRGTPSKPFLAVAIRAHQQKIAARIGRAIEQEVARAG